MDGGITVMDPSAPIPPGKYVALEVLYSGPPAEGEKVIAPLAKLGKPLIDTIGAKPEATAYWKRHTQKNKKKNNDRTKHSQDARNVQVLRDLWKVFEPFTKGYYVNTEPSENEQRLRETYGDNYSRLVQLKNKYDPGNLYRLNANIKP